MRVLIADKLAPGCVAQLQQLGFEALQETGLSGGSLTEKMAQINPEVLVVRSTKVQREHLHAAAALSLVVRAGAGVNIIALDDAATRSGIPADRALKSMSFTRTWVSHPPTTGAGGRACTTVAAGAFIRICR